MLWVFAYKNQVNYDRPIVRAGMLCRGLLGAGILSAFLWSRWAHAQTAPSSSGTAFFVNADGWAITNAHVLEGCARASVSQLGNAIYWIIDRQNDLAIVRVSGGSGSPFLRLKNGATRLGDDITAFGYPLYGLLSDSIKVTTGNINSLVESRTTHVTSKFQLHYNPEIQAVPSSIELVRL